MLTEETKLINGCKKGDRAMQKALYEYFAPKMFGVCMRYTNNKEVARDLLQDGFIKVFTNFSSYKGSGSLEGWLRKIFVNTSLEYLRKNDVLRNTNAINDYEHEVYLNDEILEKLSTNDVMRLICELPLGYRTVFNLFVIEGYSHKEIAKLLRINESTSRSQYVRAKQMLQKKLDGIQLKNKK